MEQYIKIRDTFREAADIIDELVELDEREKNGEYLKKETEAALGRFMMKMLELQALQA